MLFRSSRYRYATTVLAYPASCPFFDSRQLQKSVYRSLMTSRSLFGPLNFLGPNCVGFSLEKASRDNELITGSCRSDSILITTFASLPITTTPPHGLRWLTPPMRTTSRKLIGAYTESSRKSPGRLQISNVWRLEHTTRQRSISTSSLFLTLLSRRSSTSKKCGWFNCIEQACAPSTTC